MRHRPEASEQGIELDLAEIEGEMRRELASGAGGHAGGHTARTLVRLPDLRVVLIVMQAGSRVTEHVARETATLQVLSGRVSLGLGDRVVELAAGRLFMLPGGLRHEVLATSESAFLLTLGRLAEKG